MKIEKKYLILISVVLVIIMICLFGSRIKNKDVATKKTENGSRLPEVKIDSVDSNAINKYLEELYNEYAKDKKSKFTYTYEIKDNIISILAIIDEYNDDANTTIRKYMAFNIDKLTGEYLSKDDIIEKYNIDIQQMKETIENHFKIYYDDEAEQQYLVKEECDFTCYLSYMRGIDILLDQVVLVIENNSIVAYTNFDVTFGDDSDYFKNIEKDYYRTVIKEL